MSKYYMVYLKYENLCMVCTKVPFTKDLYREIITNRIIYPENNKTNDKLTYDYLPNGKPRCYEITKSKAKEWLCELNTKDYIYNLQRIEDIITKSKKIEIDANIIFEMVYKTQEKEADKTIKQMLRKIKQR